MISLERVDALLGALMCRAALSNVRPEKRQAATEELESSRQSIAADLDTLARIREALGPILDTVDTFPDHPDDKAVTVAFGYLRRIRRAIDGEKADG